MGLVLDASGRPKMAAAEVEACALWRSTDFLIPFLFVVTRGKYF